MSAVLGIVEVKEPVFIYCSVFWEVEFEEGVDVCPERKEGREVER